MAEREWAPVLMRLERLDGMTWAQAVAFMDDSRHALALETTPHELKAAKTAESHGAEAGAAVVVAYRFMESHGPVRTAWMATRLYDEITPSRYEPLSRVKEGLCWSGTGYSVNGCGWPVEPPAEGLTDKRGGLANVMLAVAASELAGGATSDKVAAAAIVEFLDEGMKAKGL